MTPAETAFLLACDAVIKDRLQSPASYQRFSAAPVTRQPAALLVFLRVETPEKMAQRAVLEQKDPRLAETRKGLTDWFNARARDEASSFIEYDATNAFGASLRSGAKCTTFIDKDAPFKVDATSSIRVDNMTKLDWDVQALHNLNSQTGG